MNIDAVNPESRIDREKASILLGYAAGRDGRLYATDEAVDDWLLALGGGRFGTAVEIIRRHYASYDPQSPTPLAAITPGYIRHNAVERKALQERKEGRAPYQIESEKRSKKAAPRWFIEHEQSKGRMLALDPMDYENRPRHTTRSPHTGSPEYDRRDIA